jgi:hypothetical protein
VQNLKLEVNRSEWRVKGNKQHAPVESGDMSGSR